MTVGELISRLSIADPNAVVLHMDEHADASDAAEIREIFVPDDSWTCERHATAIGNVEIYHPTDHGLSVGWDEVTSRRWEREVVVLSTGPTNLRFSQ
jgi:hypothetical protein